VPPAPTASTKSTSPVWRGRWREGEREGEGWEGERVREKRGREKDGIKICLQVAVRHSIPLPEGIHINIKTIT